MALQFSVLVGMRLECLTDIVLGAAEHWRIGGSNTMFPLRGKIYWLRAAATLTELLAM